MHLSVWAQDLIDHLTVHMESERDALTAYGDLLASARDARIGLLVQHVLDDEVRHHQQFAELRDRLRTEAEGRAVLMRRRSARRPVDQRASLLDQTQTLLALERRDRKDLRALAKRLRQVEDTRWQSALVDAMELDTRKHIKLLEAVRELLRQQAT